MPDFSRHQKKIIERYYDHRDQIMLARLEEIVTELYLAESDRRRTQLWTRVGKAMQSLKILPTIQRTILAKRDPESLARHVRSWLDEAKRQKDASR